MSLGIFVVHDWFVHYPSTSAQFHWTAQLSCHPCQLSLFSIIFSVYVLSSPELVWKFQLEYWNRFVARAVHSFTSHLCPLEELEVLSFPFFSLSGLINGLSDKAASSQLLCLGCCLQSLSWPELSGVDVFGDEPGAQGWYGWAAVAGGLDRCGISTCWGVTPQWSGPQMRSDPVLSDVFRAAE